MPSALVVTKDWKSRPDISFVTPGPLSHTATSTPSPSVAAVLIAIFRSSESVSEWEIRRIGRHATGQTTLAGGREGGAS